MLRINSLLVAVALAAGAVGCTQCDTCDDFPTPCVGATCGAPTYTQVGYTMTPGSSMPLMGSSPVPASVPSPVATTAPAPGRLLSSRRRCPPRRHPSRRWPCPPPCHQLPPRSDPSNNPPRPTARSRSPCRCPIRPLRPRRRAWGTRASRSSDTLSRKAQDGDFLTASARTSGQRGHFGRPRQPEMPKQPSARERLPRHLLPRRPLLKLSALVRTR